MSRGHYLWQGVKSTGKAVWRNASERYLSARTAKGVAGAAWSAISQSRTAKSALLGAGIGAGVSGVYGGVTGQGFWGSAWRGAQTGAAIGAGASFAKRSLATGGKMRYAHMRKQFGGRTGAASAAYLKKYRGMYKNKR